MHRRTFRYRLYPSKSQTKVLDEELELCRDAYNLIKVNPRGTTQTCSRCGERVSKTLSDRIHECPCCGLVMNRDENAALRAQANSIIQV